MGPKTLKVVGPNKVPPTCRDVVPLVLFLAHVAGVVALAWWVLDAGGELCRDPDAWEELERRVSPPRAASAAG